MSFKLECGIMVEPQEGMTPQELLRMAKFVEDLGFGYFLRSDHITTHQADLFPECWVSLGAIATATQRVRFGPLVSPVGFRNPALLARMACTVDDLSSGRLQLGFGAGHVEDEYLANGFEFPSASVRRKQFREALKIIRPLTQTDGVEAHGKYFSALIPGRSNSAHGIPLVVGGRSTAAVRDAIEYADEWNCSLPLPPDFQRLMKIIERSERRIGVSQMGGFVIAENEEELASSLRALRVKRGETDEVAAMRGTLVNRGWFIGTARELAEKINEVRKRGIDKIYFQMWQTKDYRPIELLSDVLNSL